MPRLKIYKASAGSGKTFQLVREYLQLVFNDPYCYKHILAVTFTNKSTAEMKDRLIRELVRLSSGDRSDHLEVLMHQSQKKESFIRERAKLILSLILHDYAHFSISTIDSFFQRLVKSFARDIGLSAGFRLEMDTSWVLEESIEKLIAELHEHDPAAKWIRDFALSRVKEGKNWNFRKELKDLGSEVFREKFQLNESRILSLLEDSNTLIAVQRRLFEVKARFEADLTKHALQGIEIMQIYGISVEDFSHKSSSFAKIFIDYAQNKYEPPGIRARDAMNNFSVWCSNATDVSVIARCQQAYESGLNQSLVNIIEYYDEHAIRYCSAVKTLELFYQFVLVADIQKYIRKFRDIEDTMLISDTASFISQVIGDRDDSFIFEKAGNYYLHYLIDEFQDTSVLQWHNFKPLLSNSISQDGLSMVVGDVKQSIYRFRNGDWRLLLFQARTDIPYSDEIILDHNYRSDPNVIRFNNTLFHVLPGIFSRAYQSAFNEHSFLAGTISENAGYFELAYQGQEQKIPLGKNNNDGFVQCSFIESTEELSWKERVLQILKDGIDDCLDRGFKPGNIVVLVRDSKDASQVYDYLTMAKIHNETRHSYDLLTEKSLLISSSSAVRLMVAAIHYLIDPFDKLRKAQTKSEYYVYLQNQGCDLHKVFDKDVDYIDGGDPLKVFFSQSDLLRQQSIQEISTSIIKIFSLASDAGQLVFLQGFQDLLIDFLKEHESSLLSFVEWWEQKSERACISTPENINALWILTIHKSKGLEFPVVFVPFCDWHVDHYGFHSNFLWTSVQESPFDQLPVIPVKYSSSLLNTYFAKEYAEERLATYLDNLNLLYVALTRAVHELVIFAEKKSKNSYRSIGEFIRTGLSDHQCPESELFVKLDQYMNDEVFQLGQQNLSREKETKGDSVFSFDSIPVPSDPLLLGIRSGSYDLYYKSGRADKIHMGNLVHELLFRLHSWNDLPVLLDRFVDEGKLNSAQKSEMHDYIQKVSELPSVKPWFAEGNRVYKERRLKGFGLETIVPDRIVISGDDVFVIDFKTGEQREQHERQVALYMDVLKEMGYGNTRGYLLYTATLIVKEVGVA